jgi:uncharacterized protein YndB with AHSA1/START domain
MSAMAADLVVRKSITVDAHPERAFAVFTERIGSWWPVKTHSLAGEHAVDAVLEPQEGGRIYEVDADGNDGYWGTVVAWEPPHRLVIAWNVGRRRDEPTEVEVRFLSEGEGTRVELEHRGWERWHDGAEAQASYETGWDTVLAPFSDAVREGSAGG